VKKTPPLNLELAKKDTDKLGEKVGNVPEPVEPIFFRNGFPKEKEVSNVPKDKEILEGSVVSYSYTSNFKDSLEKEVVLSEPVSTPKTTPIASPTSTPISSPTTTPISTPRTPRIEHSNETKTSTIQIGEVRSSPQLVTPKSVRESQPGQGEVKIANYRDRSTFNGSSKEGQTNNASKAINTNKLKDDLNHQEEEDILKQLEVFTAKLEQEHQLQFTRVTKLGRSNSQFTSPPAGISSSPKLRSTDPKT